MGTLLSFISLKSIYFEEATVDLFYEVTVEILKNFVGFSEYMNFKIRFRGKISYTVRSRFKKDFGSGQKVS